jgi:hypothetical protein
MSEDGIGGTDMTPPQLRSARYAAIRGALAKAKPTDNQTYLLAQIALILCDVMDEVAGLSHELGETNAYLNEVIVHRKPL